MNISQILKYFDIYGEKCSFYVEKTQKLYSVTGGVLSIISICICIVLFIFTSMDDFQRISPFVNISSETTNVFHKIKFGKEKIWIPWRIRDYSNHFVNHTNLFYPFVYNYYTIKKTIGTGFEFRVRQLNYTLCNQTSFINKSEIFYIDSSLDELYCIDMDEIDVGGDWTSDFLSYIEFDLYLCKEGIDYDENNPYCTKYENISNYMGKNNSLLMSLYYPTIHFKANESINPVNIIYRERFYHFSRYSNKIDRIFLQKNIIKDDLGWIVTKYNETSYWDINKFEGDSYTTGDKKDLMNEGSTSRVYSFNIYLMPTINIYFRSYKKIYIILSECLPIIYIVIYFFKMIANFCKFHTINQKFTEFLFVNLKGKSDIFDKKVKELKEINEKALHKITNFNINNSFSKNEKYLIKEHKDNNDIINANLPSQKNHIFSSNLVNNSLREKADNSNKDKDKDKDNSIEILNNNQKEICSNKNNNKLNVRPTIKTYIDMIKIKRKSARRMSLVGKSNIGMQNIYKQPPKNEPNKHFVEKKLFPSRYYFYVIFIKNLDFLKKTKCVSNKFSKSYIFLTKILDIYTYLDLIRQFNAFKYYFLNENNVNIIERQRKININEINFARNINECIENNNFRIFGKMKETNN